MGDGTISMAEGLGSRAEDSNEVRRKQGSVPLLQSHIPPTQTPKSGTPLVAVTTPRTYSELCPEIRDTPLTPLPQSTGHNEHGFQILSNPSSSTDRVQVSTPRNPNGKNLHSTFDNANNPSFGPHSPNKSSPNSARKLQKVFKKAEDRLVGEERIAALVHALEEEMKNSGTKVACSELRIQLIQLQAKEIISKGPSSSTTAGNSLKIGFHYPESSSSQQHSQTPTKKGLQVEPYFKPQR